jgi:hypothetical protein
VRSLGCLSRLRAAHDDGVTAMMLCQTLPLRKPLLSQSLDESLDRTGGPSAGTVRKRHSGLGGHTMRLTLAADEVGEEPSWGELAGQDQGSSAD